MIRGKVACGNESEHPSKIYNKNLYEHNLHNNVSGFNRILRVYYRNLINIL